jgi:hypothetical protein
LLLSKQQHLNQERRGGLRLSLFLPMKKRMRFTGSGFCQKDKVIKSWKAGDWVDGEFEGLLPDTYSLKEANTMMFSKPRPITRQRKSKRSSDYTVAKAKLILATLSEEDKREFLTGETRKSLC